MTTAWCRPAGPPRGTGTAKRCPRVLLIEHEASLRGHIARHLQNRGFAVIEADNGPQALELLFSEAPQVVLCEQPLPWVDGPDILEHIAARAPHTPLVVISAVLRLEDALGTLRRGAWDLVAKPIRDMVVLETAVLRALSRARALSEVPTRREHLETVNEQLTMALDRLEADQQAGREIQFRLLPRDATRFGGYAFSRRLYPSMGLSGDFIDYFALDTRHAAFYMADVAGHGTASALITVMLKTLMSQYRQAYATQQDATIVDPAETLQRLDHDLRREGLDQYLTLFYGVIDRQQHQMAFCNAGHFPYPVLAEGEDIRALVTPGQPVGLFDNTRFHCHHLALPEEFALLLVSDGILELLPQRSLRDKQAALQAEFLASKFRMESLVDALALSRPRERPLPDDIALLLVRRDEKHG